MANGKFVSYLRVSTSKQGVSGLGVEAQREAVTRYLNGGDWKLISEFVEIESGRKSARPKLAEAMALCRAHRAALVVAKVDRLTRSVAFLNQLLGAGVEICFVDLPDLEGPIGEFLLQQMASVAQLEAGMIRKRTKDALAEVKRRGVKLGGARGRVGTAEDVAKGRAARTAKARQHASDLAPAFARIEAEGATSLRQIAAKLKEEGFPTPRGDGVWTAAAVQRVKARLVA